MSEAMNRPGTEPPAGEAGVVTNGVPQSYSYWNGDAFGPWCHSAGEAFNRGDEDSLIQWCSWRFCTLAELLAAGLTEAEALPMLHHSQRPKGDGWIAWAGGECPIPGAKAGEYEVRWASGGISELTVHKDAADWNGYGCWKKDPGGNGHEFIAYRLLKPMTATEVLSRQKPEEPGANADMMQRDLRPPTQREFGYAIRRMLAPDEQEEPPEAPELLIVAPIGQRCGSGWWGVGRE